MGQESPKRILFFDGVCNLCNSSVDFLVRRQKGQRRFFIASLQGETARGQLDPKVIEDLNSMVYHRDGRILFESTAVINAIADLGGVWVLMRLFLIFPEFLRNPVYRFIAKNRYKWFGEKNTCRLPTEEEKSYFLP